MQTLKIPTFWNAEQADSVYQFLGELQQAIWQQYHQDIQRMYDEIRDEEIETQTNNNFDDELDF